MLSNQRSSAATPTGLADFKSEWMADLRRNPQIRPANVMDIKATEG
jgi:hypothetical protein